jgi:hypothetical protein
MMHPPFLAPLTQDLPRDRRIHTDPVHPQDNLHKAAAPAVERLIDVEVDVNNDYVGEDGNGCVGEDGLASVVDVDALNEAEGVREAEVAHESVDGVLPSQVARC